MELKKLYSLDKISEYVGGDKDEILEMITLFLETIPTDIDKLPEFANNGDWQSVYKIAHKVKPSFDVFAMDDIHADLRTIEVLARNNNEDGNLVALISELIEKVNDIVLLLKAEVDE
ncbi:MAG: Hpt domain-containing protein [Bacteroidota bacterium]